MLFPPHSMYNRLYVYYLDRMDLPRVDDPDHIGTWIEDDNAILFFHTPKDDLVRDICSTSGSEIIYQADLDYQDWEAGTNITSFATKTLAVQPVWENNKGQYDGFQKIILDPSVIFGSGFHATTRLCLETLELVLNQSGEKIESVLDLGTGTGLLAIAAAKFGVDHITAVDNNPLACEVARRNVQLNRCDAQVRVKQLDLKSEIPDIGRYDLVIANLYKELLLTLVSNTEFWNAKMYMLSGFIVGMEPELLASFPSREIIFLHRGNREKWRLWLLKKKKAGL